jgi:hypothetical protein
MREALETEDRLGRAEISEELERMTTADWVRVDRLAARLFEGVSAVSAEDLPGEACAKLLSEERIWPRGFAAIPAILSVLESMASNYRKREKNGPIDVNTLVSSADALDDTEVLVRRTEAVNDITPERALLDKQQLERVEALVSNDDELALIAIAWAEGITGKEAADELGMNWNQYEAARKRLVRLLAPMKTERSHR